MKSMKGMQGNRAIMGCKGTRGIRGIVPYNPLYSLGIVIKLQNTHKQSNKIIQIVIDIRL
jgi:hypothetical protein